MAPKEKIFLKFGTGHALHTFSVYNPCVAGSVGDFVKMSNARKRETTPINIQCLPITTCKSLTYLPMLSVINKFNTKPNFLLRKHDQFQNCEF